MADRAQIEPGYAADAIRKAEAHVLAALGVAHLPGFVRRAVLLSVVGDGPDREPAAALIRAITEPINNGPETANAESNEYRQRMAETQAKANYAEQGSAPWNR